MTDDHHDEGLAYDVGTILTRRRMLGLAVGAGAAAFLAACGGDDSGASVGADDRNAVLSARCAAEWWTRWTATRWRPARRRGLGRGDHDQCGHGAVGRARGDRWPVPG